MPSRLSVSILCLILGAPCSRDNKHALHDLRAPTVSLFFALTWGTRYTEHCFSSLSRFSVRYGNERSRGACRAIKSRTSPVKNIRLPCVCRCESYRCLSSLWVPWPSWCLRENALQDRSRCPWFSIQRSHRHQGRCYRWKRLATNAFAPHRLCRLAHRPTTCLSRCAFAAASRARSSSIFARSRFCPPRSKRSLQHESPVTLSHSTSK